jgi:hypothetical protein
MSRANPILLIVGTFLLASGCGKCPKSKCSEELELSVHDVNGTALLPAGGVSLESSRYWSPCSQEEVCTFRVVSSGDYTVTAPGYKSVVVHVGDERDDCGDPISQWIDVTLVAEGEASNSTSKRTLGGSCSS